MIKQLPPRADLHLNKIGVLSGSVLMILILSYNPPEEVLAKLCRSVKDINKVALQKYVHEIKIILFKNYHIDANSMKKVGEKKEY